MKPMQSLPDDYSPGWKLDLKQNMRLNIILQVFGLALMVISGWLLTRIVVWLRPELVLPLKLPDLLPRAGSLVNLFSWLVILLVLITIIIVLHELVHGLFFWLFTRKRPEFGLGPGYFFAAMPNWFFPRRQYLLIGLAPLLVLTALGLALSLFLPTFLLVLVLACMAINAGGAIGDIYVCWRIICEPSAIFIRDTGDGFQVYMLQDR